MAELSVLFERAHAGDKEAREVLIEKNLGLVRHIVKRFMGRGYEAEDLFQIGTIGLMKSIDKFDISLGLQFSTYAVPMIAGEIKRFLRDDGPIKVSRTLKENAGRIAEARNRFIAIEGRDPRLEELKNLTGFSVEEIVQSTAACSEVESIYNCRATEDGNENYLIDHVVKGQGGVGISQSVPVGKEDAEKEALLNHMLLTQLLDGLPKQERQLIIMRYFDDKTQMQVAACLGISQVQVSRMEKRVLIKMREKVNE